MGGSVEGVGYEGGWVKRVIDLEGRLRGLL